MGELERVQVLIGAAQRRTLARIARREKTSVSELLRELIERGLEQRTQAQTEWQASLERLRHRREKQKSKRRPPQNLVAQVRRERERQIGRAWRRS